jgi:hypothetical protein
MAAPTGLTPPSDASYLRRLLERQPNCLVRVRLDGVLLACNDAALRLFGVGARRAVLNTNLTDRIVPAQHAKWQEFATRCWANGAASLKCDLVISDNNARPVLIQGVALKDHADGFESLLLNLRDKSQTHRLEHSIQNAEIDRVGNEERQRAARDQIEESTAERLKLSALADEDQAERQRLTEALEAQTVDRQRKEATFVELEKKVEESQLVLLQREREHRRDIATLKSALAAAHAAQITVVAGQEKQELEAVKLRLQAATAEQARFQALVAEYEVDRKRIAADHQSAVDTLEQSLARAGEEAALGSEQSRQALAELRSKLVQALAEQSRMAARAEEQKRQQDLMRAEHHRALADLETSKDVALAELRSQLAQTSAEEGRLAARVEEFESELDLLRAEHHRALADLEVGKDVVAELRRQLSQSAAEQSRMAAPAEEQKREQDLLRAEHHRALADLETSKDVALADLHSQLAQTSAEQGRLAARVEGFESELDLIRAEHHQALADLEVGNGVVAELQGQLSQASAEQGRLAARLEEHELAHDRLIAEHHRTLADMETGKCEALAALRSQQSQAFADQRRLAARFEEHQRERDSVIAEHHRALADMETAKGEALAELRSQLVQAFADQRRLASRADEQELERDRMRAEHYGVLADLETRKRDALAELRLQLSLTSAEPGRILAERAEEQERERERMTAEHNLAIADLQASKGEALAELRSQLSQAAAEQNRLTALLEEHDRGRERMGAEYRRAIADLQVSKREAVTECERVLTEVQHALLVRDGPRFDIERRLIEGIDDGVRKKADGERVASLQRGLTLAFSEMQAVLKDGEALNEPLEAENDDLERPTIETIDKAATKAADDEREVQVGLRGAVSGTQTTGLDFDPLHDPFEDVHLHDPFDDDPVHDPFDDADVAFVRDLLEGIRERPLPENLTDPTVESAPAVSEMQTVTTGGHPAQGVFDAQDDAFVDGLMKGTPGPPRESADQTDAEPMQELPEAQTSPPEDS